jgi:hypothetical protein
MSATNKRIQNQITFRFNGSGEVWNIPRAACFVHIFGAGAGGAGGNGFTRIAGNPGGGGGGGGCGAVGSLIIPTTLIGEALFIKVGTGGRGATAGTETRVSWSNNPNNTNLRTLLVLPNGAKGGNGTASAAGTSGAAGTWTLANSTFGLGLGVISGASGQAGAAGGIHTGAIGAGYSTIGQGSFGGGAGGGGARSADFAGGSITLNATANEYANISGGAAGSNNGASGYINMVPLFGIGGGGGGASNAGVGGNGGNGGEICAGGGGGGAGTTGGVGGNGGNGIVMITWW